MHEMQRAGAGEARRKGVGVQALTISYSISSESGGESYRREAEADSDEMDDPRGPPNGVMKENHRGLIGSLGTHLHFGLCPRGARLAPEGKSSPTPCALLWMLVMLFMGCC